MSTIDANGIYVPTLLVAACDIEQEESLLMQKQVTRSENRESKCIDAIMIGLSPMQPNHSRHAAAIITTTACNIIGRACDDCGGRRRKDGPPRMRTSQHQSLQRCQPRG